MVTCWEKLIKKQMSLFYPLKTLLGFFPPLSIKYIDVTFVWKSILSLETFTQV